MKQKPFVEDIETYAQDIVDTVRKPLLMLDTTLRVRSANRAFYQTFQVTSEETENRLIYELGNGQWDIPALRMLLEDIIPTNSVFNDFELEHDFPVIGRRVMLLNARKLQAGHHGELLVLAMEDVTERRRSEANLKAIETYAQNIVDTVREPLLILDTTLRVRSANRAFYQTFKVSLEETENRLIYELGNGQWDIPVLRTLLEDIVPLSSVFNDFQLEHDFPGIGRRVMLLNARKLQAGHHGELLVLAMEDVTDRKRFEQTLQEKNVELEKANLAKDRFLASMSHELRTPLNAIIGFTGTLLMGLPGPLTPDQKKQLQIVKESANHQLSLINDLLDLAKIESGKVELNLEPVECRRVLEEVAQTLRPLADAKGLNFDLQLSCDEGIVLRTDRRAVSQILINLINNAIKFTDQGAVELSLRKTDDAVEIDVTDTGIGIKPDDQAKLFRAFTRLNGGASQRTDGTGLGLHLSQKLAALLGGRIQFESVHGKGSKFSLVISDAHGTCR